MPKKHRLRSVCLRCSNQRVWLEFSPDDAGDLSNVKMDLAPLLSTISAGLKCIDIPNEYRRDRFVWRAAPALAFSTATLVLGVFGIMRTGFGSTDIVEPKLLIMACLIPALLLTAAGTKVLPATRVVSNVNPVREVSSGRRGSAAGIADTISTAGTGARGMRGSCV